jgi:hypothetical protein
MAFILPGKPRRILPFTPTAYWPLDNGPHADNLVSGSARGIWRSTGLKLAPSPGRNRSTQFSGVAASGGITISNALFTGTTDHTIAIWALTSDTTHNVDNNCRLFSLVDTAGTAGTIGAIDSATAHASYQSFGVGGSTTAAVFQNNIWAHWTFTFASSGSVRTIYKNGVVAANDGVSPGLGFDTVTVIGARDLAGTGTWFGQLANLILFLGGGAVLSAVQVAALYAAEYQNFFGQPTDDELPALFLPSVAAAYRPYRRISNWIGRI